MSRIKVGDRVSFIDGASNHEFTVGSRTVDLQEYDVVFPKEVFSLNDRKQRLHTYYYEKDLELVSEAPEDGYISSEPINITITMPKGTRLLNGEYEADNGIVYKVKVEEK